MHRRPCRAPGWRCSRASSVGKAVALLERAQGKRVTALSVRLRAAVPLGSSLRMRHAPEAARFAPVCDGRLAVEGSYRNGA